MPDEILVLLIALCFLLLGLICYFLLSYLYAYIICKRVEKRIGIPIIASLSFRKQFKRSGKIPRTMFASKSLENNKKVFEDVASVLDYLNLEKSLQVVAVTSINQSVGKSCLVYNLSRLAKEKEKKVCVVDMCRARPTMHHFFAINKIPGLVEYFNNTAKIKDIIKEDGQYIDVICLGDNSIESSFNEAKFSELITYLRSQYQFVVIDTPSAREKVTHFDCKKYFDGSILLFSRYDMITKNRIEEMSKLKDDTYNFIGAVMI